MISHPRMEATYVLGEQLDSTSQSEALQKVWFEHCLSFIHRAHPENHVKCLKIL